MLTATNTDTSASLPASTPNQGGVPRAPAAPPIPLPIRTFPLPQFFPSNPLSWIHIGLAWISHAIRPPREPSVIYEGVWSPKLRCVYISDPKSKLALWEHGYFGKGQFSRSQPNHFKRTLARAGAHSGFVAEEHTIKRREEKAQLKWDRARKEQEAIQKVKLDEAWVAPVGPKELLALPNSLQDIRPLVTSDLANGSVDEPVLANGHVESPTSQDSSMKRRKSVRFSPSVQSATFQHFDPPSPGHSPINGNVKNANGNGILTNGTPVMSRESSPLSNELSSDSTTADDTSSSNPEDSIKEIVDTENLILTREEAFFLTFGLGVLAVKDENTGKPLSVEDLFLLFRQHSYFPPRSVDLLPDDPFLTHYAVYHHFRSLGWTVRPGIKFGVDWLLYARGPAYTHAEFAVTVMSSYEDSYWQSQGRKAPQKPWNWLTGMHRVQARAVKTPVLAYVEIPPPSESLDISSMLKGYKVREFILKRWVLGRNRGMR